jgi:glycerol-3-phosphate acyltransferase PlsY
MTTFITAVFAYVLGSAPVGLLIGRWVKGIDIREHGSGNIGTTNVLRTIGVKWATLVFVLDAAKGALPILIGQGFNLPPGSLALVAFLAVAGHNWSIFLRFRGGKGVATTIGALCVLSPLTAVGAALVWITIVLITGYASLGSMSGLTSTGPILALLRAPGEYVYLGLALAAIAVFQHRANIGRLLAGKELRILRRGKGRAADPKP